MLTVKITATPTSDEVSCILLENSLAEMRKIPPTFCLGWILGAIGRWTARSNYPNSIRIETDALFQSLQLNLPLFTAGNFNELLNLPCLSSRSQYLQTLLRPDEDSSETNQTDLRDIGAGWGCFQFFDSKKTTPDALTVLRHLELSRTRIDELSHRLKECRDQF